MAFDPVLGAPTRVLVADDDGEMRSLLTQALSDDGYRVEQAAHGLEALLRLGPDLVPAVREVDLIITDLRMPGVSGLELLRGLRQLSWDVPVILISAFFDEDSAAEALALGAVAVLSKPFSLQELRQAVERAAPRRRGPPPGRAA